MGITVAEYLKDRAPCAICDANGDQTHCVTQLLSRADNCLIYNAINNNGQSKNLSDISLLQNLRATPGALQKVLDYYVRSEPIVVKIKNLHQNNALIWQPIYEKYVKDIVEALRNNDLQQAHNKIFVMLDELETTKI